MAEADEDHGAELKALAALHGQDVDLGFPGIVGALAAALGHEQMGDAEGLELMGDAFPVVRGFMQITAMSPRTSPRSCQALRHLMTYDATVV